MKPEDLAVISPTGQHRFGRKNASSEKQMHLLIYKLRPDVHAVVHAHPPKATRTRLNTHARRRSVIAGSRSWLQRIHWYTWIFSASSS